MSTIQRSPAESAVEGTVFSFLRPLPVERMLDGQREQFGSTPGVDLFARLFPVPGLPDSALTVSGLRLGHFVIQDRIGKGGMGTVFRAVDERLDRIVALKVLSPEQSHDTAAVQRFQNEARAAARLDHEHFARVHFIGEEQGLHFIAFEFIEGVNIRELILQRGAIAPADTVAYALQIADALRHTAENDVVHRDIKPSNIVVTPQGRVKLVDLGLARSIAPQAEELTTAGTTLGTFDYISPEQALDPRNVDVRSDIYSLGCTLYHMLTGEPPYPKGTMLQKVVDHHASMVPDAHARNARVSPELSAVVRKMMATRREDRHQTPDELMADLTSIAQSMGLQPVVPDTLYWATPLFRAPASLLERNKGWIVALVALLVMAWGTSRIPWGPEPNPTAFPLTAGTSPPIGVVSQDDRPPIEADTPLVERLQSNTAEPPGTLVADTSRSGSLPVDETGHSTLSPPGAVMSPRVDPAPAIARVTDTISPPPGTTPPSPASPVTVPPGKQTASNAGKSGVATERPAAAPAVLDPFWIVSSSGKSQAYQTLEAACVAAVDTDIVELRFNGLLPVPQSPIRIDKKRLRIRPGPGFERPRIVFQSPPAAGRSTSRMISVTGGSLELYDIDIEFAIPAGRVVDRWALVSLMQATGLRVDGATLTLRNPDGQQPAACIEVVRPDTPEMEKMMPDPKLRTALPISLQECVIRSDVDLVASYVIDPLQLSASNCALAVEGAGLRLTGSDVFTTMMSEDRTHEMRLDHVTFIARDSLLTADVGERGNVLPTVIQSIDSVYHVLSDRPLIQMHGNSQDDLDEWQERIQWTGEANYLDVRGPIWETTALSSGAAGTASLNFADWGQYWPQSRDQYLAPGEFDRPEQWRTAALSDLSKDGFDSTTEEPGNTLIGRDGRPAGADMSRLPAVPVTQ